MTNRALEQLVINSMFRIIIRGPNDTCDTYDATIDQARAIKYARQAAMELRSLRQKYRVFIKKKCIYLNKGIDGRFFINIEAWPW